MGTGLNLAIAYALAEMMGGSLSCVSREGRGSEFTLGIPLPDAKTEAPAFPVIAEPEAQIETASQDPITTDTRPPPPARVEKRIDRPVLASPRLETAAAHPPSIEPLDAPPAVVQPILDPPILERAGPARSEFVDLMAPAKTHRGLHEPIAAAPLQAPVRPLRVLIVDDMMSNRDVLSLMLESKGHICRDAADGYAALSLLERQSFDLIILDIHMAPLDGIETLRRVRSSGKSFANIPVIALTADNAPSINAETMDAGADLFLTKPIKQEELFRAMGYLRSAESTRILSQRA